MLPAAEIASSDPDAVRVLRDGPKTYHFQFNCLAFRFYKLNGPL